MLPIWHVVSTQILILFLPVTAERTDRGVVIHAQVGKRMLRMELEGRCSESGLVGANDVDSSTRRSSCTPPRFDGGSMMGNDSK